MIEGQFGDGPILVTGGAGFIGSHLCERLHGDGHTVISLDNYSTGSRDNHVEGVDYRSGHTKDVAELVPEETSLVYHLGEYARVEKSFEDVQRVWDFNVAGTFAILEFCRKRSCKLVYAGSSTKFGDGGLGINQSPYAWTKAANTELVKNYGEWFGLRFAITYFYNVYGPRELSNEFGTVVAIFAEKRRRGEPLPVVSPGTQKRNFTHVLDIVEGLLLVGMHGECDEFGLGALESYSILDLAKLFGGDVQMLPARSGNRMSASLDILRASEIGWRARRRVEDYVRELVENDAAIQG